MYKAVPDVEVRLEFHTASVCASVCNIFLFILIYVRIMCLIICIKRANKTIKTVLNWFQTEISKEPNLKYSPLQLLYNIPTVVIRCVSLFYVPTYTYGRKYDKTDQKRTRWFISCNKSVPDAEVRLELHTASVCASVCDIFFCLFYIRTYVWLCVIKRSIKPLRHAF